MRGGLKVDLELFDGRKAKTISLCDLHLAPSDFVATQQLANLIHKIDELGRLRSKGNSIIDESLSDSLLRQGLRDNFDIGKGLYKRTEDDQNGSENQNNKASAKEEGKGAAEAEEKAEVVVEKELLVLAGDFNTVPTFEGSEC